MGLPQSITNESQLGAEGTYILEQDPPPAILGQRLNDLGVAGECVKGPANTIVKVNDPGRFRAIFGGRDYGSGGAIIGDVWQWELGRTFGTQYVYRVVAASGSATAEADFLETATPIINVAASSPGAWGNDILIDIEDATDGDATHFNLRATWNEVSQLFENLNTETASDDNILEVMGDDYSLLVTVTKVGDGRPDNAASQSLTDTAGADGTIADSDFTGAGLAIDSLAAKREVNVVGIAGRMNAAIKAAMNTAASAASPGKMFLVDPDTELVTQSTFETEVGGFTSSDRLVACFNHPQIYDTTNGTKIYQQPSALMASCLTQSAANGHPGSRKLVGLAANIVALAWDMSEGDYTSARAARICALERVQATQTLPGGYVFRSGVTTLPGSAGEIVVRRQKDALVLAISDRVDYDVKEPNSLSVREARKGDVDAYLEALARREEMIALDAEGNPAFVYDVESLNTDLERGQGIQRDRLSALLIPHNLWIVLVSTIDTVNQEFFVTEV